ncbi:MAG: helix-turn-helix domain-containing protein [Bythopirellula sp.]|nr:helix-turn-helix domain-containing protein [Bythopirellula sp.]
MDQFISFEEALKKLNISAERLNELRDRQLVKAYRDGSSWKFRTEQIEKMANEGVPDLPPPSDISLIDPEDLVDAEPLPDLNLDDDLGLADFESDEPAPAAEPDESAMDLRMADTDAVSAGSELELAGLEDTVTAGASDLSLDAPDEPSDPTDSILLSDEELGESVTASLSTIIGRKELNLPDADLEFELDDVTDEEDTKLSPSSDASNVLSSKVSGSGVLDEMEDLSDAKKAFKDLEELEIDLAAESSLALNPADVADAKQKAGKSLTSPKGDSDLKLGDDEEAEDEGNMGSTDVPLEDLAAGTGLEEAGDVELELAGDDDLILADAGGSDITLDSGDSGINLISPSDSGLALDDIPLDVGGSAILSSLSLEGSDPEISLLGSGAGLAAGSGAALQTDDDFQLTPLSEGGLDDGDSSSQVIALDADLGGFDGGAGLLEDGFPAEADEGVVLSEDFGEAPAGDLGMGAYAGTMAVPVGAEAQYGLGSVLLLSACVMLLGFCGLMMLDMVRNVWSWNENYTINSSLLDALLGMFGLR